MRKELSKKLLKASENNSLWDIFQMKLRLFLSVIFMLPDPIIFNNVFMNKNDTEKL